MRLALSLHCIPIAFEIEESSCIWLTWAKGKWLKSLVGDFGDWGWLKTSKSFSESSTSTTVSYSSSSPLTAGCEGVVSSLALYWRIGSTFSTPWGLRPGLRKPDIATLMRCRWGSFAFITHFSAWKLDESGVHSRIRWATHLCVQTPWLGVFCLGFACWQGWSSKWRRDDLQNH